jgi:hypothetical protein
MTAAVAPGQNCRPGAFDYDINIKCACDKDSSSEQCALYKRNKAMYDGEPIKFVNPTIVNQGPRPVTAAPTLATPQVRTPVSAALLPATTAFWRIIPPGAQVTVGMRPQWLTASPLLDQILNLGGQMGGQNMEAFRRELGSVELVILSAQGNRPPLILARATDVVHATKSERDAYRYVDPNTILVGDPNQTGAAMNRLFSPNNASLESGLANRVAAWSDVWVVADLLALRSSNPALAQLHGATKMTVGLALRDGVTLEAWFETPSPLVAKNLAAQLQKNPNADPFVGQFDALVAIEQHDSAVRLYMRSAPDGPATTGSAPAPQETKPVPVRKAVITGLDDGPREIEIR